MYDELSFGKAFKKAMREKGSGNTFTWRGKLYLLEYKDEALNKKHNTSVNTTVKEPLEQQEVSTESVVEKNVEQPLINSNQRQQLLEQPLFRSPARPEVKSLFDEISIGKEYVSKTDGKKDSVKAANDSLQAYEKLGDVEIVKNKDGSIKTDKDGSFMYIPKTTTFVDRMNEEIRRINTQSPSFDFSKMSEANRNSNTATTVETEKPIENTTNPEEKSFFSDVVESVGDFFEQGVNYVNRHFLDDTEVQTKGITIPVQQNKPVIPTENPRVFNDNINVIKELPLSSHDGYAMSGVVNLNKNKFVARNREDLAGVDKGKGVLVTTFRPFETDRNKLQRYSDILAVKKDSTVQIMPRNEFNQTKDVISGSGIDRMPFDKIETKIINGVEHVRTQPTDDFNGRVVSMGVGYNSGIGVERGRDSEEWVPITQANKFSSLMGGKVLMKVGDQQIIVSGSFKDMNDAYKELSKKTGKTPEVYKIDNGSFNLPYFKGESGITTGDLKKHQNRNNKGGHSLILVNNYQDGGKVGYDEEYFYDFSNAVDTENNFSQIPVSENGLWEYPNQEVIVPTNGSITMKGVDYPVIGKSLETGEEKLMLPNKEYFFNNTNNVHEIPKYQNGGSVNIDNGKGNIIKINRDSEQYLNLYNRKLIQGYDPKTNTYFLSRKGEPVVYKNRSSLTNGEIPEVILKGKKADWVKYKEDYIKNNPKEKFIQQYLDAYPWAHQSLNNYPKRLDEDYENRVNDYIGEQIVKNKPQGDKSREDWLNSMTEQEQRFVQRNPKYGTTLWQDTVEGGKALFNLGNDLQISRIENSDNYTNLEKKDLIQQHKENPILSNIGDVAQSLSFLTVPSKIVQSTLRPEYSFSDAVQGTKNKASMLEDIATDPLNLVGAEFFNKFDDINKIIKPLKNTVEMFPKSSNIFVKVNKESGESLFNKLFNKKIPFIQNMDDYKDYIDVLRKEEIDYMNSPEYFKLRGDNTGETSTQILKSVDKMKKNMDRTSYNITHRLNPNSGEYLNSISTFFSPKKGKLLPSLDFNPSINIGDSRYSETIEGTLSHEIKHGYSPVGTDLGIYRNYPTLKVKIPENKPFEYYLSRPYEQQVRFNKIKSTLQKDLGVKRGTPITEEHLNYYFNKPYDVRIDGDVHELFNNLDDSVTKHDALDVLNKAWSVIPIAGGIGYGALNSEDETPQYQDGGQILNDDKVREFYNDMLSSPLYKQRLEKNGYKKVDNVIKKRLNEVNKTALRFDNDQPTSFERTLIGKTRIGTPYINFNSSQIDDEDGHYNGVLAHEYGHGETTSVPLSDFERNQFQKRFKVDDVGNMSDQGLYMSSPEEAKSDINAIRYKLFEQGKFNPKTGEYKTPSNFFEPSLLEDNQDDFFIKRMKEAYGNEGTIDLMNIIANNNDKSKEGNWRSLLI